MKYKTLRILLHIAGVLAFLSLPLLFKPSDVPYSDLVLIRPAKIDFLTYALLALFFYLNFYLMIPGLYFSKRYFLFVLLTIFLFLIVIFLPPLVFSDIAHHHRPGLHRPPDHGLLFGAQNKILLFILVFFFSLILRLNMRWKQAEKERTDAELSHLKAQINPHFLFNTLNSIYSLALDQSAETAGAVVKLSGMMRYVISEASHDFVPLEKEIRYVTHYVELQKIRLQDTICLEYAVEGKPEGKKIAPLVLIPFVENAFKYGVNPEENSNICIRILIEEHKLTMTVSNQKVRTAATDEQKSGLGIRNTSERLRHLYPGSHTLVIRDDEEDYTVILSLNV